MDILGISQQPTTIDNNHESLYRAYSVLELVKNLLARCTPGDVVLDIVESLERSPQLEASADHKHSAHEAWKPLSAWSHVSLDAVAAFFGNSLAVSGDKYGLVVVNTETNQQLKIESQLYFLSDGETDHFLIFEMDDKAKSEFD